MMTDDNHLRKTPKIRQWFLQINSYLQEGFRQIRSYLLEPFLQFLPFPDSADPQLCPLKRSLY